MKKFTLLLFILMLSLTIVGCNKEPAGDWDSQASQTTETQNASNLSDTSQTENETGIVKPMDSTINIKNLTDGTFSVALDEGAFYVDENGKTVVVVTVYDYGLYEADDIQNLKLGDTILILDEEVLVSSLEQSPLGNIIVNGGFEMGGYDFTTKNGDVYYIIGASDTKTFYELGLATLSISDDFVFYDEFDMDHPEATYSAEDCLAEETPFFYSFSQYNTTIVIEDGYVTEMHRIYTP